MKIKNGEALSSHGSKKARTIALDVTEFALKAVDGYERIKRICKLKHPVLMIGKRSYNLTEIDNVYVVGAGKATMSMAEAVEEILSDIITEGIVIVKRGQHRPLKRIAVHEGGHPLPNEVGFKATQQIVQLVEQGTKNDLFIILISGGSSALMNYPVEGITLEEERQATDVLLRCGANIMEINAIRRHISQVNGGRLAQRILDQGSRIINLIISDVVGDLTLSRPDVPISNKPWKTGTPAMPDRTTFDDARAMLSKYQLWDTIPNSVQLYLKNVNPTMETPKTFEGMKVDSFVLAHIANACLAAKKRATQLGYNSMILSTMLEGESWGAGYVLASIAKEATITGHPIEPPCVIICGGETTVKLPEQDTGQGGPSQELALGFSLNIDTYPNIAILSIDTDGTDGPTEFAGAIADGYTVERAEKKGLDAFQMLFHHNSTPLFQELDDALVTGETGTNVCDLNIIVINKR